MPGAVPGDVGVQPVHSGGSPTSCSGAGRGPGKAEVGSHPARCPHSGGGGRSREARCAHGTEWLEAWLVVWGEKGWGLGAGWVVLGGSRGLGRSQDAFGDLAGSGLSQGGPCW